MIISNFMQISSLHPPELTLQSNYLSLSPHIKLLLVLTRWSFIPLIHILQKVTFLRICHTNIKLWLLHGNFAIEIPSQKPNWKQSIVTLVAVKRPSSQTALTPVVLHLCTHNSLQKYLSLWAHKWADHYHNSLYSAQFPSLDTAIASSIQVPD